MRRYLVIANQTLGGEALAQAIRERAESGSAHFHVVVPDTNPEDYEPSWVKLVVTGVREETRDAVGTDDDADVATAGRALAQRARHRLREMIDRILEAGGEADGEIGDPDPYVAVRAVLRGQAFDEVIISTMPAGVSRWLRLDLPHRVGRIFDGPVTVVEARRP